MHITKDRTSSGFSSIIWLHFSIMSILYNSNNICTNESRNTLKGDTHNVRNVLKVFMIAVQSKK